MAVRQPEHSADGSYACVWRPIPSRLYVSTARTSHPVTRTNVVVLRMLILSATPAVLPATTGSSIGSENNLCQ